MQTMRTRGHQCCSLQICTRRRCSRCAIISSSPLRGWVARAARNPLTLDELVVFSRKLLNIAFVLYWRKDPSSVQQDDVPGLRAVK